MTGKRYYGDAVGHVTLGRSAPPAGVTRGLEQARLAAVLLAGVNLPDEPDGIYDRIEWEQEAWNSAGRLLDWTETAAEDERLRQATEDFNPADAVPVELVASADLAALRAVARAADGLHTTMSLEEEVVLAQALDALPPSALGEEPARQEQPKARTAMDETVLYVYGDRDAYLEGSADPLTPAQLQEWAARFLGMANEAERRAVLPGEIDETEPGGGAE